VCLRGRHGRVLSPSSLRPPTLPAATPSVVQGDGSNDHPFVAPCDDPGNVDCTITAFPERSLSGAWANEYVPAYQCPAGHQYLLNHVYGPSFTSWGPGVEIVRDDVEGLGFPIQVAITGFSYFNEPTRPNMFSGTLTGFPNSSATTGSGAARTTTGSSCTAHLTGVTAPIWLARHQVVPRARSPINRAEQVAPPVRASLAVVGPALVRELDSRSARPCIGP
jgi:hypothetical protein